MAGKLLYKKEGTCFATGTKSCALGDPRELSHAAGVVWEIWRILMSQWRRAGMDGTRVGLEYGVIRPVADLLEVEIDRRGFLLLVRMEREYLSALAERKGA